MGLKQSPAAAGKKSHLDKATSSLAKTKFVTKPESRMGNGKGNKYNYSVSSAESQVKKLGW